MDVDKLNLQAVIGFGGSVPNGLIHHPSGDYILYPLGSSVVIKNLKTSTQTFLEGHTDKVSCVALSNDGKTVASGQETHMGFKAPVIVWDFHAALEGGNSRLFTLDLHKVLIQDLSFSPDNKYLATLGGRDDNNLVIWEMKTGTAVCGSPASTDSTLCVRWLNESSSTLVTGGYYNLRLWQFEASARKVRYHDCVLGAMRRVITSICVSEADEYAFCGTQTGDVLKVAIGTGRLVSSSAYRYALGVRCSVTFEETDASGRRGQVIIIGNGDGTIVRLRSDGSSPISQVTINRVQGAVTSITMTDKFSAFIGTDKGNTYTVNVTDLEFQLKSTSHFERINDIFFPKDCSTIFVTCSVEDIRIWNSNTFQELLRIRVPNLECSCVCISSDGRSVVSGWNDGKIRAFFPESGKLQYTISDAHENSVTAIAMTNDNSYILSGGKEGMVRVWRIKPDVQTMVTSLKEHKSEITCIKVCGDDTEAISSSADGSCIAWDLRRYVRLNAVFASTMFQSIIYHPDESQILTCGSDRKITYWDAVEGHAIRVLTPKGCEAELTSLDIEASGQYFVCGGQDRLVRLWKYDEGIVEAIGVGHSGGVSKLKISPDSSKIISVGVEGAVFVWKMPTPATNDADDNNIQVVAGESKKSYSRQESKEDFLA